MRRHGFVGTHASTTPRSGTTGKLLLGAVAVAQEWSSPTSPTSPDSPTVTAGAAEWVEESVALLLRCHWRKTILSPPAQRLSESHGVQGPSPGSSSTMRSAEDWDEDGWDYEVDSREWVGERNRAHGPERDFRIQSWVPSQTRAFGNRRFGSNGVIQQGPLLARPALHFPARSKKGHPPSSSEGARDDCLPQTGSADAAGPSSSAAGASSSASGSSASKKELSKTKAKAKKGKMASSWAQASSSGSSSGSRAAQLADEWDD